jgi:cytochrome c oxidase assembly factor CtaG
MLDLLLAALAVVVIATYGRGYATLPGAAVEARRERVLAFAGGFGVVLVALASPFEHAADASIAAHMAQHVLLLTVAAPLLVAARPTRVLVRGLPETWQPWCRGSERRLASWVRRRGFAVVAAGAVALETAVVGFWHLPGPFDAALHNSQLHSLEHVSFLVASLAVWALIASAAARGRAVVSIFCIFATGLACTALGAALALAPTQWYGAYSYSSPGAALADQQLGGMVMWGFGNLAVVVAGAVLVGTWLAGLERRTPSRRPAGRLE